MKELLLAKANIKKSKGLTVGLILLIILASCFLNAMLILFTDYNKNPEKNAKRLNTEDALVALTGEISEINDDYIKSIISDEVEDYEISRQIGRFSISTPYSDGEVTPVVFFSTEGEAFNCKLGKTEIVNHDSSIKENYVYLPYQYNIGGGFDIGDDYKIKILEQTYNLKIKGFTNNISCGCYNSGIVQFIVSDDVYESILTSPSGNSIQNIVIKFDLKDGVDELKFANKFTDKVLKDYQNVDTVVQTLESAIFSRTFISVIFAALFLVISAIVVIIVLLMLSNNISNYIKENMKTIGAIKALGYTNNNIKISFLVQFLIISAIGCVLGIGLSYVLTPALTSMLTIQAGIPYTANFNWTANIITIIMTIFVVIVSVLFFLRKTGKITPITALRDGLKNHNFKKNRIKLEKSRISLNLSLAMKTTFFNIRQNIVTFIIMFALVFMSSIVAVLFQNLAVKPKMSLLTFEICDGAVGITDSNMNDEIYEYIKSQRGVKNVRLVVNYNLNVADSRIMFYIIDNEENLNNKDVCYKGRLPKYDNEIALSGKVCKSYNYNIGDEIEIVKGNQKQKYILSGFIQTTNNVGKEGVILEQGAQKILGADYAKNYYFDTEEGTDAAEILKNVNDKYGDAVSTFNFQEIISGSIAIFKIVATSLVVLIFTISVFVILLVLYLLIKTLINNKKKDYGILKAVGYTSKDIILQNALSFMPTIILSVVVSTIVSYFTVNPCLGLMMNMFGVMKVTFEIPVAMIIGMGIALILISYIIAIALSRKVKKIEPYKLLTEE